MKFKKIILFALGFMCVICSLSAQTLFTYGAYSVSKQEFLQAYNKNPDTTGSKAEKMQEYLELYINFRLKLQAAHDEKVNENSDLKAEGANFKNQLAENFINQQADISLLVHEAFLRSQKDILLQQIFVPFTSSNDTISAFNKINEASNDLKTGKTFEAVAEEYAVDAASKAHKGTIGYVTVFTLPYSIENIVYSLQPGDYSNIYKSTLGYHIFKNAGERKSAGIRKIQQLLFSSPSVFSDEQQNAVHSQADSVYKLLNNGASFSEFLPVFGHGDNMSDTAGTIEVKVGDYNSDFETAVFNLKQAGDISKPFKTEYGYNIIRLITSVSFSSDENDIENASYIQTQIQKDNRLNTAKKNLIQKWLVITKFKDEPYNRNDLWAYSDSALKNQNQLPPLYKSIKPTTILFEFEKKKLFVSDWIQYLQNMQMTSKNPVKYQYEKLMKDFINASCNTYYRDHIELYNSSLSEQLKEFNDANMLFYAMDKHVWSKAAEDSAGLKSFYNQHINQYTWNKSLTALIISGPAKSVIDELADKVKSNPYEWRNIIKQYGSTVYADSSRFESDQLPVKQQFAVEKHFQTQPESNETGNAFTFIHVFDVFPQVSKRSFEEAKGLIINDYQQALEQAWLTQLKKTYPVKINESVLNTMKD